MRIATREFSIKRNATEWLIFFRSAIVGKASTKMQANDLIGTPSIQAEALKLALMFQPLPQLQGAI